MNSTSNIEFEKYLKTTSLKFTNNYLINCDFLYFLYFFKKKKFRVVAIFIEFLAKKTKAFYTEDMYLKLHSLISAFITIKRFYQHKNDTITKCMETYVNTKSLELSPLEDNCLKINNNNNIYRFNTTNLIQLIRYNIENITDQFYLCQTLSSLKNPYTNLDFSLKEKIMIYENIKTYYLEHKKIIPEYIINFKKCYFDEKRYSSVNFIKLLNTSADEYLNNINNETFKEEFLYMVSSSPFIKRRYCSICFKKINLKNNFSETVKLYILNSNNIFSYGYYEEKFKETCYLLNIRLELGHNKKHRRAFKIKNPRNSSTTSPDINVHPLII